VPSIVRPDRDRSEDRVLAVTHDQTFANPALKAKTPFVKPPVYIDYGIRLHVGGSTFINRNCVIMDTPVADVVIGEGCNIGANCTIIGVTRKCLSPPTSPLSHPNITSVAAALSALRVPFPTPQSAHAAGLLPSLRFLPPQLQGNNGRLKWRNPKDPLRLDERLQRHSIGQPVTIGNDVWIGANVTIL
jgi:acetyltransferase-like isoleucine patch superfamily enzyme